MEKINNFNILITEDEKLIRTSMNAMLSRRFEKGNVFTAENGAEALEILENNRKNIWLIISDYNMPEINGITFYKTLTDETRKNLILFIFCTGEPDSVQEEIGAKSLKITTATTQNELKNIVSSKNVLILEKPFNYNILDNILKIIKNQSTSAN